MCKQSTHHYLTLSWLAATSGYFWKQAAKKEGSRALAPACKVPYESPWCLLLCYIFHFFKKLKIRGLAPILHLASLANMGLEPALWCQHLLRAYEAPMESSWCVIYCSIFHFFKKLKIGGAVPFFGPSERFAQKRHMGHDPSPKRYFLGYRSPKNDNPSSIGSAAPSLPTPLFSVHTH